MNRARFFNKTVLDILTLNKILLRGNSTLESREIESHNECRFSFHNDPYYVEMYCDNDSNIKNVENFLNGKGVYNTPFIILRVLRIMLLDASPISKYPAIIRCHRVAIYFNQNGELATISYGPTEFNWKYKDKGIHVRERGDDGPHTIRLDRVEIDKNNNGYSYNNLQLDNIDWEPYGLIGHSEIENVDLAGNINVLSIDPNEIFESNVDKVLFHSHFIQNRKIQ